jgi:hypothetical protein
MFIAPFASWPDAGSVSGARSVSEPGIVPSSESANKGIEYRGLQQRGELRQRRVVGRFEFLDRDTRGQNSN